MNPYKVLRLEKNCTIKQIKTAYREMSKQCHPDKNNGNSTKFMQVNLAYRVLSDEQKRRLYDEQGIIMDDKPDHVQSLVQQRLAVIANHWIDNMVKGHNPDLTRFVISNLDNGIIQVNKSIDDLESAILKLEDISKRLKHEDGESVIHNLIRDRIRSFEKGKKQNKMELEVIDKVKEAINKYDYEIEEVMQVLSFDTRTSTTYF